MTGIGFYWSLIVSTTVRTSRQENKSGDLPMPGQQKIPVVIDPALQKDVETAAEAHPPVVAYSTTTVAAVSGTHTTSAAGSGVFGTSPTGDGVHGESQSENFSGVAGIHTKGGKGVYGSSSGYAGWFQGNVQITGNLTVAGDILLTGADCAEQFDSAGRTPIEPGTLVVMDDWGALKQSESAYDRKVAGVVAGAGEYRPGIILDKNVSDSTRTSISLIGKAYCKVDAGHGSVEVGDLLTSSPTPGHAMKATDQSRAFGAVVGKALRPLKNGQSMIPILVTLQ
jgi:hypothetical protein